MQKYYPNKNAVCDKTISVISIISTEKIMPKIHMNIKKNTKTNRNIQKSIQNAAASITCEINGLQNLKKNINGKLGQQFADVVHKIHDIEGRTILCGMGKSSHVGRKIAATMASTGTPALFIHPAEASHGDLGMITQKDCIIFLSNSGETQELKDVLSYSKRFKITTIAITANPKSTLAQIADITLEIPKHQEACPIGLAPTTSSTMQMVLGHAIAIALLEKRGFSPSDFKKLHPGGKLGAALNPIEDIMHKGNKIPLAPETTNMSDAIPKIAEKGFGCLGLTNTQNQLSGIITDGDLRRHMSPNLLNLKAHDIMTKKPITVKPNTMASAALEIMNRNQITGLFVVKGKKPIGFIHLHDLMRIGVI